MRTSVLLVQKFFGFFEIYGVPSRTRMEGKLSQCGHFSDKGSGVNFSRFCSDFFYGRYLTAYLKPDLNPSSFLIFLMFNFRKSLSWKMNK